MGWESVRAWVHQADIDAGAVRGVTSEDRAKMKALEQEVR